MTANLTARVWKHRHRTFDGFSKEHGCTRLVWFEQYALVTPAIAREEYPTGPAGGRRLRRHILSHKMGAQTGRFYRPR
ncbi:GIY-YIG nuclease family protein [Brevundimonas goettingensis]|uniref:Uncharacterized protein n=1 Tax=Brevundimonas goettingensis TaxID=2774190 RepID=A0A975GVM3_9CAUL|nr:hypothetical protein [Brevundimonas goettingensis]QTC90759.1 hypothetical protein IFJ75_16200 [Brevundimonas goettingensis]